MWSYPNPQVDRGRVGARGHGKELTDLLVVFERNIIIFSDKHCVFNTTKDTRIAWRRWYKAAVLKSARQVRGAERWLREHPDRVYLDKACTERLPIEIPKNARIHRVLVCRGAARAAEDAWGAHGQLLVTNRTLPECAEAPHRAGAFDDRGTMHHVIDSVALDLLLSALDTVSDFVGYLDRREALFRRERSLCARGEAQLLANYLLSDVHGRRHRDFDWHDSESVDLSVDDPWKRWLTSPQRSAKTEADRISYAVWDDIIKNFTLHITQGTQEFASSRIVAEQEPLLRWMAREQRVRRRVLSQCLAQMVASMGEDLVMRRRYEIPQSPDDPVWTFLVFVKPRELSWARYRELRRKLLMAQCHVVKHLFPQAQDVLGLAVNPRDQTEDLMYLDARQWDAEDERQARRLHEEAGIFRNARTIHQPGWEYPIP